MPFEDRRNESGLSQNLYTRGICLLLIHTAKSDLDNSVRDLERVAADT